MAQTDLKPDAWMKQVLITEITHQPTEYEFQGKTYKAKYGVIWYTLGGRSTIYPWQIRKDSNEVELNKLQLGKTYDIFRHTITTGYQTGYDWTQVVEHGPKPRKSVSMTSTVTLDADLFPLPTTPRQDVEALIPIIAEQTLSPEVEALLFLVCMEMDKNPRLFQ